MPPAAPPRESFLRSSVGRMAGNEAGKTAALASTATVMVVGATAVWLLDRSPYGRYLDHRQPWSGTSTLVGFLAGWNLMVAAMMAPSAFPMLHAMSRLARRRPDKRKLQLMAVGGFAAAWTMFGLSLRLGDLLVHAAVASVGWLASRPSLVAAAVLAGAGLYQLSPVKTRCLTKCRAPAGVLYATWTGATPGGDAFRFGVGYGVSCVGCCLGLMVVVFAIGLGSLGWMLLVGAVMAFEKNAVRGPALRIPLAVLLVLLGSLTVFLGGAAVPG